MKHYFRVIVLHLDRRHDANRGGRQAIAACETCATHAQVCRSALEKEAAHMGLHQVGQHP